MDRKDDQFKQKMIAHAWKLLSEELIKYRGNRIILAAMSCCLRSLLVVWKVFVQRRVSVELMDIMVELSSALSVLFTTLERYYQHLKAIISAFGNVQYHGEISLPLGGTLSHCIRCSSQWRGKWIINLLMVLLMDFL